METAVWKTTGERLNVEQEKVIINNFKHITKEISQGKLNFDALYGFNIALDIMGIKIIEG